MEDVVIRTYYTVDKHYIKKNYIYYIQCSTALLLFPFLFGFLRILLLGNRLGQTATFHTFALLCSSSESCEISCVGTTVDALAL